MQVAQNRLYNDQEKYDLADILHIDIDPDDVMETSLTIDRLR